MARFPIAIAVAFGVLVSSLSLASRPAQAQFIVPSSYTLTPGQGQAQGGSFNYFDDGGVQLTDGILGADNWQADLGNGSAFEWVGWRNVDPTATFTFSAPVNLSQIQISFNRTQGAGIFLPQSVTIDGAVTNLTGTEIADNTRGFLSFPTNFSGTSITIDLADGTSDRWIFVDEVRFVSRTVGAAAPEPGTLGLLLLGGLGGLTAVRRR